MLQRFLNLPTSIVCCLPFARRTWKHKKMWQKGLTTAEICTTAKPIFLRRTAIRKVELFGSFANGTATEDSDLDFLVDVDPLSGFHMGDLVRQNLKLLFLDLWT